MLAQTKKKNFLWKYMILICKNPKIVNTEWHFLKSEILSESFPFAGTGFVICSRIMY